MKKIIVFTLLCLLCGTAAGAQTLKIAIKEKTSADDKPVAVLTLDGKLTAENIAFFTNKTREVLNTINRRIVINMGKVDLIDGAGLGALQSLRRDVDKVKGGIRLCEMKPEMKLVFEVTALDTVFEIFTVENDALKYTWY